MDPFRLSNQLVPENMGFLEEFYESKGFHDIIRENYFLLKFLITQKFFILI